MKKGILMLKFRTPECRKAFLDKVGVFPEVQTIKKNNGATPTVIKELCDEYSFDIKKMFYVDLPGRKELDDENIENGNGYSLSEPS